MNFLASKTYTWLIADFPTCEGRSRESFTDITPKTTERNIKSKISETSKLEKKYPNYSQIVIFYV